MKRILATTALLALAGMAFGQAIKSDSPTAALDNLLTAIKAQDGPAVKKALYIDKKEEADVDVFLGLMRATDTLQKNAAAKFGADQAKAFGASTGAQIDARLKILKESPVKIDGDTAVMTIGADEAAKRAGGTLTFKRTGEEWKVEARSLFSLGDGRKTELAKALSALINAVAKEVQEGKFVTANEAAQSLMERSVAAAVAADRATSQPATQPTTQP